MSNPLNLGLVTTVAGAASHIDFFLNWHFSIGFNHIFIFIDDNCVDTYRQALRLDNVTVILRDSSLEEHWRDLPPYFDAYKRETVNSEVMTRQEFNVYHATVKAKLMGIDWLVHLDIDELFYPNGIDLQSHFKLLDNDNVGSFIYQNYEAIQTEANKNNIYQSTCYFKVNYFRRGSLVYRKEQREFLSTSGCVDGFYFNFYQNGKSAFNLSDQITVHDVHYIRNISKNTRFGKNSDPIVLHYPCASYEEFRKKYEILGDFSDNWNNKPRAGKFINTFHLEARDAWLRGDESDFKTLYENKMLYKRDFVAQLIRNELAIKIDDICAYQPHSASPPVEKSGREEYIVLKDAPGAISREHIALLDRSSKFFDPLSREFFIHFSSEKDASKWIRRHPLYKTDPDVVLGQDNGIYYVYWRANKLLDFDRGQTVDKVRSILDGASKAGFLQIDIVNLIDFSSAVGYSTIHQFRVRQIERLITIYQSIESKKSINLLMEVPDDCRSFLTLITGVRIINRSIIKIANEAIVSGNPKYFIEYVENVYPPNRRVTSVIDVTSMEGLSYRSSIYVEILLFLGGTIVYDSKTRKYCQEGLRFRDKNPTFATHYAYVRNYTNQGKLLILEKTNGLLRYFMLCNMTGDTLNFGTSELNIENKLVDNITKNKKHIVGKLIELQPFSSLIIKIKL